MNKRMQRILIEMLLVILVTVGINFGLNQLTGTTALLVAGLGLIGLVWLTLRHGSPTGIIAAAISGLAIGMMQWGVSDTTTLVLIGILPMLMVGLAGFFSKYTQKTLNNRRLSSTYLNIYTASFLVSLAYYLMKYLVGPMVLGSKPVAWTDMNLWLGVAMSFIVLGSFISVLAKAKPDAIIPKRSKYLSRKETSSLLND